MIVIQVTPAAIVDLVCVHQNTIRPSTKLRTVASAGDAAFRIGSVVTNGEFLERITPYTKRI